jgi:catechol 2,3-dioxygenase-like lactoylglutathione lyase family enzyme
MSTEQIPGLTRIRPQPLITVSDVPAASRWYQAILGASSGHGGAEYERLLLDGSVILQLHHRDVEHHHGRLVDPGQPSGNGVALWFEVDEFDALVARCREARASIEIDVHVNPNAGQREIWLRDLDGYLVVFAERTGGESP